MSHNDLPAYDVVDLARRVETLTTEQTDRLSFGAIRVNEKGAVSYYSAAERRLSGFGSRDVIGRDFFTQIAPCMDNEGYRGRIDRALAAGKLDLEFSHIGDFDDRARELTVRVQSASDGGFWIFMRRES